MYERAIDIKLERLTLARAHPCDLYATYEIMSDPETMHYCSTIPHQSCGQTATWFERIITLIVSKATNLFLNISARL
jgi:hypothetical protein